jgi:hypothetical protein
MTTLEKQIQKLKDIQSEIQRLKDYEESVEQDVIKELPYKKGQEIQYKGWDCEIRKIMIVGDFEYGEVRIMLDDIFGEEEWVTLQDLLDNEK